MHLFNVAIKWIHLESEASTKKEKSLFWLKGSSNT
jgi:hypothetical protein